MGNRYIEKMDGSLDGLIVALCHDYPRRAVGSAHRRVDMEYRYINTRMLEAVSELYGERYAPALIHEIGEHIGHANSALDYTSETNYKRIKYQAKLAIARKLYLFD